MWSNRIIGVLKSVTGGRVELYTKHLSLCIGVQKYTSEIDIFETQTQNTDPIIIDLYKQQVL